MKLFNVLLAFVFICFSEARILVNKPEDCSVFMDKYDYSSSYERNFLLGRNTRWPNGVVPFKISNDYNRQEKDIIYSAISHISHRSCIKWVEYSGQKNYVFITPKSSGCFANLGYNQYRGKHILNLQKTINRRTCMIKGIAAHEMMHILGMAHEQTRPDRDHYVKINWKNAKPASWHNFFRAGGKDESPLPKVCDPQSGATNFDDCYSGFKTDFFGLDYDFGSLMHYGLYDFTRYGRKVIKTLVEVPIGVKIGQRKGLSNLDIQKLNNAYPCNEQKLTTEKIDKGDECFDIASNCKHLLKSCRVQLVITYCKSSCGYCILNNIF